MGGIFSNEEDFRKNEEENEEIPNKFEVKVLFMNYSYFFKNYF